MRLLAALVLTCGCVGAVEPAWVSGFVLHELTGQPIRRVQVTLRPGRAGEAAVGALTDDRGRFEIVDIPPGSYSLIVERDGFLGSSLARLDGYRMPRFFRLNGGDRLENLQVRLRPWSVIAGRVRHDDAEPAVATSVLLYQQTRRRGRSAYRVAATIRTNDRGEYRVYGLAPGAYLMAARYDREGAFERLVDSASAAGSESYGVTFYPSASLISEAMPIDVGVGQELLGVDVYLKRVRKRTVRGIVTSGWTGRRLTGVNLGLEQMDRDNAGVLREPVKVTFNRNGEFEMRDVLPGRYLLVADTDEGGRRLVARRPLTVGEASIEGIELVLAPEQAWTVRIRSDDARLNVKQLRVLFVPGDATAPEVEARLTEEGLFRATLQPDQTYDVYLDNLPSDAYQKETTLEGKLVRSVSTGRGEPPAVLVVTVAKSNSAVIGQVMVDGWRVASGVNVTLVPEPLEGRAAQYRETFTNEYGWFEITGIAPGRYRAIAWSDEAPCDFFDAAAVAACGGGIVEVTDSGRFPIGLRLQGSY
ncbi:MAG: carboxypeptidase regulatory-like domain-containing protein [Bryobacteraceae bacterium]|nr:carboxypeptidase regulatory-like domain-containing protein [Bryobacteraceae bacterium]